MPFPFYWLGAAVAAAFLIGVMTVFGLLLRGINRAATEMRGSILPGLVSGIRDWAERRERSTAALAAPPGPDGGSGLEETPPDPGLQLEHVRRAR